MKERIEKAIKELKLTEEEVLHISVGNMERICKMAQCEMLELMKYLRYER